MKIKSILAMIVLMAFVTACETSGRHVTKDEEPTKSITVSGDSITVECDGAIDSAIVGFNCTDDKCIWTVGALPDGVISTTEDYILRFSGTLADPACVEGVTSYTIDIKACDSADSSICQDWALVINPAVEAAGSCPAGEDCGPVDSPKDVTPVFKNKSDTPIALTDFNCYDTVYSATIDLSNTASDTYTWTIDGTVPVGLVFNQEAKTSKSVSVTRDATAADCKDTDEPSTFTVNVCSKTDLTKCASQAFTITKKALTALTITPPANGCQFIAFNSKGATCTLTASGGSGHYKWDFSGAKVEQFYADCYNYSYNADGTMAWNQPDVATCTISGYSHKKTGEKESIPVVITDTSSLVIFPATIEVTIKEGLYALVGGVTSTLSDGKTNAPVTVVNSAATAVSIDNKVINDDKMILSVPYDYDYVTDSNNVKFKWEVTPDGASAGLVEAVPYCVYRGTYDSGKTYTDPKSPNYGQPVYNIIVESIDDCNSASATKTKNINYCSGGYKETFENGKTIDVCQVSQSKTVTLTKHVIYGKYIIRPTANYNGEELTFTVTVSRPDDPTILPVVMKFTNLSFAKYPCADPKVQLVGATEFVVGKKLTGAKLKVLGNSAWQISKITSNFISFTVASSAIKSFVFDNSSSPSNQLDLTNAKIEYPGPASLFTAPSISVDLTSACPTKTKTVEVYDATKTPIKYPDLAAEKLTTFIVKFGDTGEGYLHVRLKKGPSLTVAEGVKSVKDKDDQKWKITKWCDGECGDSPTYRSLSSLAIKASSFDTVTYEIIKPTGQTKIKEALMLTGAYFAYSYQISPSEGETATTDQPTDGLVLSTEGSSNAATFNTSTDSFLYYTNSWGLETVPVVSATPTFWFEKQNLTDDISAPTIITETASDYIWNGSLYQNVQ